MWETVRIVKKLMPKYVIWENVPNVLSDKHVHNFEKYLSTLADLGYASAWKLLNSKDYGVPQNRNRLFVVSVLGGRTKYETTNLFGEHERILDFDFPKPIPLLKRLKDVLEDEVDDKFYLSDKALRYITDEKRLDNHWTDINPDVAIPLTAKGQGNWTGSFIGDYQEEEYDTLKIKEATSTGYAEAHDGDSVNLAYPNSKTRRGRVGGE